MTREASDLRLLPAAVTVWGVTAAGLGWSAGRALVGAGALLLAASAASFAGRRRVHRRAGHPARRRMIATALVLGAGALAVAGLRGSAVREGPVADLAEAQARVAVSGTVTRDPVTRAGSFGPQTTTTVRASTVSGRGQEVSGSAPLLVFGDDTWSDVELGEYVAFTGRLEVAAGGDVSAVVYADPEPVIEAAAAWPWRSIGGVRAAIWDAVQPVPSPQRALLPALVDGDDSQISDAMAADFEATGLTHLLAVSGTNLTLVLSFTMLLARWAGVRGRALPFVGLATVTFFVLLARPEPSVLRAAAMGVVGLTALAGDRGRSMRQLNVAVVMLLLVDPWLARSVGFLLSALATAGIVLLARPWTDTLDHWMPRPLAEAIAVPLAAQVVCTPVIAAISGQVSLVAVAANLLVAPAVGPATVLGLSAGSLHLVSEPAGAAVGWCAGLPAWWIVTVAGTGAGLRGASIGWSAGVLGIVVLTLACIGAVWVAPRVLRQPVLCVATAAVLAVTILRPWGRIGWPPATWLLVMCDVGQGDALVANVGERSAVVIDAGPDPAAVDRCLDDLDVQAVPLVVLTHFHADHVAGLAGVLDGRDVGQLAVSPLAVPADGASDVARTAAAAGLVVDHAFVGEHWEVGPTAWDVLGPPSTTSVASAADPDDGSTANNASVILRLETHGWTFLLGGDAEPEEEGGILAAGANLTADVVKVSHHGSGAQDPAFYEATGAEVALISVGAGNDYGHPAVETLALLDRLGAATYRTDLDGDVAVVTRGDALGVVTTDS